MKEITNSIKYAMKEIIGYRLLDKKEVIKNGDVAGWSKKQPIDMNNWKNQTADRFNQPVFRPISSFTDFYED